MQSAGQAAGQDLQKDHVWVFGQTRRVCFHYLRIKGIMQDAALGLDRKLRICSDTVQVRAH